jgi:hypothetical protein
MTDSPIRWQALERPYRNHPADWFFAVGIIALALAVGAFLFDNTLFGILIILATISVFVQVKRVPRTLEYEASNRGIKVGNFLYPYQTLESFGIDEDGRPLLILKSTKSLMPQVEIPLGDTDGETVRVFVARFLPEETLRQSTFQKILDYLGF